MIIFANSINSMDPDQAQLSVGFLILFTSVVCWYILQTVWTQFRPDLDTSGCVAQSVMCLATDASLTADPGVASSIPARSHTSVEIDHEIISTVILLPSDESFKKGCCQLQAKVCAWSTG